MKISMNVVAVLVMVFCGYVLLMASSEYDWHCHETQSCP